MNADILCGNAASDKAFKSGKAANTVCGATCAADCFEGEPAANSSARMWCAVLSAGSDYCAATLHAYRDDRDPSFKSICRMASGPRVTTAVA